MFKIQVSGLKLMAKAGTPLGIELIPVDIPPMGYYMTVIIDPTDPDHDRGLVMTKLNEPRIFKNVNKALMEIERLMPNLNYVTIMTTKAAKTVRISTT